MNLIRSEYKAPRRSASGFHGLDLCAPLDLLPQAKNPFVQLTTSGFHGLDLCAPLDLLPQAKNPLIHSKPSYLEGMAKIIHAISGPRNISTALMYSFAQRPECAVFDEPMYGLYLRATDVDHPGREEVLEQWPSDLNKVTGRIAELATDRQEIYLKNMAHHMEHQPWGWSADASFVFFIRHPRKVVESFAKVIDQVQPRDIGLSEEWDQWNAIADFSGPKIIVDSDELLTNPAKYLPQVCEGLEIPWRKEMLEWTQGPKPYDGPWWPYWYENVHKSTGLGAPKAMPKPLAERHEKVVEACLEAYENLYENRLVFR